MAFCQNTLSENKIQIYTPKRVDEHPHPFHMRSPPGVALFCLDLAMDRSKSGPLLGDATAMSALPKNMKMKGKTGKLVANFLCLDK